MGLTVLFFERSCTSNSLDFFTKPSQSLDLGLAISQIELADKNASLTVSQSLKFTICHPLNAV